MTYSQTQSKKYTMKDKLAVGVRWQTDMLCALHPGLSAQDLAALAATIVVKAFQRSMGKTQVGAMFAQAMFDGDGAPGAYMMPGNTEFLVDFAYTDMHIIVGDRPIIIPRIQLTAYRLVQLASGFKYPPLPSEQNKQCRGVLELTLDQGIVLITEHKGWIGSNEIVAYLRNQFEAAVEG